MIAGPDTGPVVYPVEPDYAAAGLRLRPGVAGSVSDCLPRTCVTSAPS